MTTGAKRLAGLAPELSTWAKQLGASVSIEPDGFVLVEGANWFRRYGSLDELARGVFHAPSSHGAGRYDRLTTPEEKARAWDSTMHRRFTARAAEAAR